MTLNSSVPSSPPILSPVSLLIHSPYCVLVLSSETGSTAASDSSESDLVDSSSTFSSLIFHSKIVEGMRDFGIDALKVP